MLRKQKRKLKDSFIGSRLFSLKVIFKHALLKTYNQNPVRKKGVHRLVTKFITWKTRQVSMNQKRIIIWSVEPHFHQCGLRLRIKADYLRLDSLLYR